MHEGIYLLRSSAGDTGTELSGRHSPLYGCLELHLPLSVDEILSNTVVAWAEQLPALKVWRITFVDVRREDDVTITVSDPVRMGGAAAPCTYSNGIAHRIGVIVGRINEKLDWRQLRWCDFVHLR